ncbi:hypothetical protein ACIBG8_03610 [Nonomuraea sp. NPDC050556]|uniref:hypothetical protein n=1 Tax=Nonomuraea sp. NPDC050556 TaxID=3364369 RepID=UPI0037B063C0
MGKNDDLSAFLADHTDHLARTAYLLTGDHGAARELTVRALITVGKRWPRWYRPEDIALREILRDYLTTRPPVPEDFPLSGRSPSERAALVARSYCGLPDAVTVEIPELFAALHQEYEQADEVDLAALAAAQPPVDVADEVLRAVRGNRRRRIALTVGASALSAGVLAAAVAVEVVMVAGRTWPTPAAMPATLSEPVAYAYRSLCEKETDIPCLQWRLITVSGKEWRVPDAAYGDESTFHITLDGTRVAYVDTGGRAVARDLTTGVRRPVGSGLAGEGAFFVSSRNGRYIGLNSTTESRFMLDLTTGVSTPLLSDELIAIDDQGTRFETATEGGTTTLTAEDVAEETRSSAPLAPGQLDSGAVLAPDGHTLAVVSKDRTLITIDATTGKPTGNPIDLNPATGEKAYADRWLNGEEVLVRIWTKENERCLAINPITGAIRIHRLDMINAFLGKLD